MSDFIGSDEVAHGRSAAIEQSLVQAGIPVRMMIHKDRGNVIALIVRENRLADAKRVLMPQYDPD